MAVLAATGDGYRIISSSGAVHTALEGHRVDAFTPGPNDTWIAIVDEHHVWQHGADGEWTPLATADAQLVCLVTLDDVVYAGAVGPAVLRLADGALVAVANLDEVQGRAEWHRVGWDLHVRSMTTTGAGAAARERARRRDHPLDRSAARRGNRRSRSTTTCTRYARIRCTATWWSRPQPSASASVVTAGAWHVIDDGLHATYACAVAFDGDDVLVSVSDGPFASRSAIYRVRDVVDAARRAVRSACTTVSPSGSRATSTRVASPHRTAGSRSPTVRVRCGSARATTAGARAVRDLPSVGSVVIV